MVTPSEDTMIWLLTSLAFADISDPMLWGQPCPEPHCEPGHAERACEASAENEDRCGVLRNEGYHLNCRPEGMDEWTEYWCRDDDQPETYAPYPMGPLHNKRCGPALPFSSFAAGATLLAIAARKRRR
jgi:hypothetical protein